MAAEPADSQFVAIYGPVRENAVALERAIRQGGYAVVPSSVTIEIVKGGGVGRAG